MNESKSKFEELKERARESLLQLLREEFEKLAPTCEDRIGPDDDAICFYHGSTHVNCRFPICPRLDLPLHKSAMIEASSNLKRRRKP